MSGGIYVPALLTPKVLVSELFVIKNISVSSIPAPLPLALNFKTSPSLAEPEVLINSTTGEALFPVRLILFHYKLNLFQHLS